MGGEAATYVLAVPRDAEIALLRTLYCAGAEQVAAERDHLDYCLRDPARYWIDLRLQRRPELLLQLRIALTNDPWSFRVPLQRALTPLPPGMEGLPVLDADGEQVTIAGSERWWYAIEQDFGRRRDAFVAIFGDITAAVSVRHVYLYVHQERRRRDVSEAAAEWRELEIDALQRLWDDPQPPRGGAD